MLKTEATSPNPMRHPTSERCVTFEHAISSLSMGRLPREAVAADADNALDVGH